MYVVFAEVHCTGEVCIGILPGQYEDAETGLYYNWHRYYDAGLGRYGRADPIGKFAGINLYQYAVNNPIKVFDNSGLIQWDGFSFGLSFIVAFGASSVLFVLKSQCINGKQARIKVLAAGPGAGFGAKVSFAFGSVGFNDYLDNRIEPSRFNGVFALVQAAVTLFPGIPIEPNPFVVIPPKLGGIGPGVSVSAIRLGEAFSPFLKEAGYIFGFDYSVSGVIGTSTVITIDYNF